MKNNKPKAKVLGKEGNVFNLLSICSKSLKDDGQHDNAKRMTDEVFESASYEEALRIMSNYCELI